MVLEQAVNDVSNNTTRTRPQNLPIQLPPFVTRQNIPHVRSSCDPVSRYNFNAKRETLLSIDTRRCQDSNWLKLLLLDNSQ